MDFIPVLEDAPEEDKVVGQVVGLIAGGAPQGVLLQA